MVSFGNDMAGAAPRSSVLCTAVYVLVRPAVRARSTSRLLAGAHQTIQAIALQFDRCWGVVELAHSSSHGHASRRMHVATWRGHTQHAMSALRWSRHYACRAPQQRIGAIVRTCTRHHGHMPLEVATCHICSSDCSSPAPISVSLWSSPLSLHSLQPVAGDHPCYVG